MCITTVDPLRPRGRLSGATWIPQDRLPGSSTTVSGIYQVPRRRCPSKFDVGTCTTTVAEDSVAKRQVPLRRERLLPLHHEDVYFHHIRTVPFARFEGIAAETMTRGTNACLDVVSARER